VTTYILCFALSFSVGPAPPLAPTLPLHAALPISDRCSARHHHELERVAAHVLESRLYAHRRQSCRVRHHDVFCRAARARREPHRSEEHTSELQSRVDLVCRLLLEKKKTIQRNEEG